MGRILDALTDLQERKGWLAADDLRALAEELAVPLHRLESLSTFYTHFRRRPPAGPVVSTCRDVVCRMAGGLSEAARNQLREAGVVVEEVSCLGRCDSAPASCFGHRVVDFGAEADIADGMRDADPATRESARWAADPYMDNPRRQYATLRRVIAEDPERWIQLLADTGLRGMGGAGFPTARKWSLVRGARPEPGTKKHVICNADESEPGSFKDREILHDLPHLVIEGIVLAALCVGAEHGTIFVRHEYEAERRRLEAALEHARGLGVVGPRVLGSEYSFELQIVVSPGGYILGEETALLECLEDRRGEPRNKPPYPGVRGLHGGPTLVNNVETFVHAAAIVANGAGWWRRLGRRGHQGHKFISVSGDVEKPGVVLIPLGATLRELLDACGGMQKGKALGAVAPGGASSPWLPPELIDTLIDFDALREAGAMLGSGAAIFVAAGRDMLQIGLDITRFFRNESCGKCVPCRVGTEKAVKWVEASGRVDAGLRAELERLHHTLERTSICGLGQVALSPLLSIVDRFPAGDSDG